MGGLRTSFLSILVSSLAGLTPSELRADADPAYMFATCAGRLSALMEHQWLVDGPASDGTRLQRDAVLSLLEAVVTPGQTRTALHWRVGAKAAHAALLSQAQFGTDRQAALRADRHATRLVSDCTALLLGQS